MARVLGEEATGRRALLVDNVVATFYVSVVFMFLTNVSLLFSVSFLFVYIIKHYSVLLFLHRFSLWTHFSVYF